jgi:copper chaperone NosL
VDRFGGWFGLRDLSQGELDLKPRHEAGLERVCVTLCLALAAACSRAPSWPPEPAELHLGEDACAECRMIISEARYAAQLRTRDGAVKLFDDLGCLLTHRRGTATDPLGVFVLTGDSPSWSRGDRVHVVQSRDFTSPMGYGLAAFASREAAEAEAPRHADASSMPLAQLLREDAAVPTQKLGEH